MPRPRKTEPKVEEFSHTEDDVSTDVIEENLEDDTENQNLSQL